MKVYKGRVEIYNNSGRVHYPLEVEAGSWPVAAYRFVIAAIKIYRAARPGQRIKIKSLIIDITDISLP